MFNVLQSLLGICFLLGLALALSENRSKIPWRTVISALILQFVLAVILLKLPFSRNIFLVLNKMVFALEKATKAGTSFVFGYLGGGEIPFVQKEEGQTYILAFRGLPLILVVSALTSLLYYWRVLQVVVKGFASFLQKTLGLGGAEGFGTAANVFVGMIEAPLFIKKYLNYLDRGEIFSLMTSGMATIAGTMMVLYASILENVLPNAMGHLLIASLLSAPAAIAVARIMIPTPPEKLTEAEMASPVKAKSSMDAITNGTLEGIYLLINIIAMLIVLLALVSLVNQILLLLPEIASEPLSLQRLLGWVMAPVVWLVGIPWQESLTAGSLMGTKTILNEFLAYIDMSKLPSQDLSSRSCLIMTYALCGFANFGSLGIMIGGMGGLIPERRVEIVNLGLKAILAGTLSTCLTGAVVGCILFNM